MDRVQKPPWLKVRFPAGAGVERVRGDLRRHGLHTVCEGALCPNRGECWSGGTATFLLMGDVCTRGCRFCAVPSARRPGPLDPEEPERIGSAVASLGLTYVVLTSVNRDDLPDGGADHFARTVEALRREDRDLLVEILIPDFQGNRGALDRVAEAGPDVVGHNLETVERLTAEVRDPRAGYRLSLDVLGYLKRAARGTAIKSGLMLGLGERDEEVLAALRDLREAGCEILTLGQYLQPTQRHLPVAEFLPPARFEAWRSRAEALGFAYVASGPLVRSSYRAGELFLRARLRGGGRQAEEDARAASNPGS